MSPEATHTKTMNCHIHYAYIQTDELCRWHIYVLYYVIIYLYSIYIVHRYLQTTDIIWFHHVSSPIHFHLRRHPPPSMHTWRRDSHHPGLPAARRSLRRHQGRLRPSRIWIWTWGEISPEKWMIWQFHANSIYFGENHRGPSTFYTCLGWSVWIWPNAGCKSIHFRWFMMLFLVVDGENMYQMPNLETQTVKCGSELLMTSPSVAPCLTWVWSCAPVADCNMNRKGKDSWRRILGFNMFQLFLVCVYESFINALSRNVR